MPKLPPVRRSAATPPRPRVKVWFEVEGGYGFGLGLVQILQATERAGSIKAAADSLGQSYRHVWGRIKHAEQALGYPLVETQVGGKSLRRSSLTDAARQLVADYLVVRGRMVEILEREFHTHPAPTGPDTPSSEV